MVWIIIRAKLEKTWRYGVGCHWCNALLRHGVLPRLPLPHTEYDFCFLVVALFSDLAGSPSPSRFAPSQITPVLKTTHPHHRDPPLTDHVPRRGTAEKNPTEARIWGAHNHDSRRNFSDLDLGSGIFGAIGDGEELGRTWERGSEWWWDFKNSIIPILIWIWDGFMIWPCCNSFSY